jgi:RNA polymerase sigma-70 factor (ECF subfamily)
MSQPRGISNCEQDPGVLHGRFRRQMPTADGRAGPEATARAVSRAKQGDPDALHYLYVRYAGHVYGYVASIVRDEHEAEDVTQQVFAKLMVVLARYEQREAPFMAWILAVSRNVALDHMRRQRAVPCAEVREQDPESYPDPLESFSIKEALAGLPVDQREVVLLRHIVGLSPGEIAGVMGRSESSIHGLHHRGRTALRLSLRQRGAVPAVMAS